MIVIYIALGIVLAGIIWYLVLPLVIGLFVGVSKKALDKILGPVHPAQKMKSKIINGVTYEYDDAAGTWVLPKVASETNWWNKPIQGFDERRGKWKKA